MNRIVFCFFINFCVLIFHFNIYAQNIESNIVPGSYIIKTDAKFSKAQLENFFQNDLNEAFKLTQLIPNLNYFEIQFLREPDSAKFLTYLKSLKYIEQAQYNHYIKNRNTPNDEFFPQQWAMNNDGQTGGSIDADIDAVEAWSIVQGGTTQNGYPITIAIIEVQGFDINHTDINWYINNNEIEDNGIDDDNNGYIDDYRGWNTTNNTDNFAISNHGTHVAGIACAKGNNLLGVTGVSWNSKAMPICVSSSEESKLISAYGYAYMQRKLFNESNGNNGTFVVATNASFGVNNAFPIDYPIWCEFYDILGNEGILNIVATTNSNSNIDQSGDMPSLCTSNYIIVTTNSDAMDNKSPAGYSSLSVDLAAPGTAIYSTLPNNNYGLMSGTSMAAPFVSGAIAMIYSALPFSFASNFTTTPRRISEMARDILLNNVDLKPQLSAYTSTGGRLNLYNSVLAASNQCGTFAGILNNSLIYPINENITFEGLIQNANNIQWQINGINASNMPSFNHIFSNIGDYIVSLIATQNSCSMRDSIKLKALYPYDAKLQLISPTNIDCADTIAPLIQLKNEGYYDINTAQFEVYNNGNFLYSQTWNGLLKNNDSLYISLQNVNFLQGNNLLEIHLTQINNRNDDNTSNNQIIQAINMNINSRIAIHLRSDNYPNETQITIQDENENIVFQTSSLAKKNFEYNYNLCLPIGCYFFSITDQFGDGICCDNGDGIYNLYLDNNLILSGSNFGSIDSIHFCTLGNFNGITDSENNIQETIYPNPFNNKIFVDLRFNELTSYEISIFNSLGQIIYKDVLNNELKELNLDYLSKGIYTIKLKNKIGKIVYQNIVKK